MITNELSLIDTAELKRRLDEGDFTLIDVRLADDFAGGRIPGSVNNCVFEVAFLDRMAEACPDKSMPIAVYGAQANSHESRMASEKLIRAGYSNVREFRGGFSEWEKADLLVESEGINPEPDALPGGERAIDLEESRIEWTGRNLLNKHWGKIGLKSGWLIFENGQLTGGGCVLDMNAITCDDLARNPAHDILINHLKNDDFFDVERFPEGHLKITGAAPIEGASDGSPNFRITADLTLKSVTKAIEFPIAAGITPEGKAAAQASFSIDRTRWNVLYGSGKFFARLAGHLVNDEINLQLRIVTE